jgi:hypothetical protein
VFNWFPNQLVPAAWGGLTFVAGILCKNFLDSYFNRQEEARKFALDKRTQLLDAQLSRFYWPLYLHLEKDNLMLERLIERDEDPESPQSRLSIEIEASFVLPSHEKAVEVIESNLHLAGDAATVEASLRYVRHVKVYGMLRAANVRNDPISHGQPYPKDIFRLIEKRVYALQAEYDRLIA